MRNLYACLTIPDFAAAVLLRGERNRRTPPVAVYTGVSPNCFVYAANEQARQGGAREGMPLAEAVARYGLAQGSRFAGKSSHSTPTGRRPLRDEVKGKGIKPYRLRPTAPEGIPACSATQKGEAKPSASETKSDENSAAALNSEQQANRAARVSKRWPVDSQSTAPGSSQSTAPAGSPSIAPAGSPTTIEPSQLPFPHGRGSDRNLSSEPSNSQTPDLQTRERSPELEKQTQQELIEMALTVSPRVEDAAPGLLIVDLAGMPDPHGSANQLAYGAEKLGLPANVGVSSNRFVAIAAARTQIGVTHIFPGQEAGFLSVLPLDTLPLDPREQDVFARWGLHTVGDLARLPEDSLVARFGTRGQQLSQLARGRQDAVMRPYEPPPALEETTDLDWQIAELEPLAFLLSGLLERLCLKLQGHSLAAAEIRVALKLADGSRHERAVAMSHPLADPRTLLTLLRIDLAAHPPGDAVEGITVAAQPTPRRLTQFSLLDPALPSPEKLAVTLARLTHLVGPGRVGAPAVPDTHRPGAFGVETFQMASARERPSRRRGAAASRSEAELRSIEAMRGSTEGGRRSSETGPLRASRQSSARDAPVSGPLLQPLFPAMDTRPTTGSVLIFPEPEAGEVTHANATEHVVQQNRLLPALPQSVSSAIARLGGDRRGLLARVVVFPSPFHGEVQAGAPVPTEGAACRAAARFPEPVQFIHRSAEQRITRSTGDDGSTDQPFNRSTAHAFRCLRPSAEAEVLLRGNLPVYIDSFEVRGPVRARSGPWKVCGEWWAEGWNYEEWDVEVNGRLYRICCELPTRRWFVTGAYD